MAGSGRFGHREHLHLAWLALRSYPGQAEAEQKPWSGGCKSWPNGTALRSGTTALAPVPGPSLFRTAQVVMTVAGRSTIFSPATPPFWGPGLPERHWSALVLNSEQARTRWAPPDLKPLVAN